MKKFIMPAILLLLFLGVIVAVQLNSSMVIAARPIISKGEQNAVVPVVYLEAGVGGIGYTTRTYAVENGKGISLGEHNRTYSHTYPNSRLEAFDDKPDIDLTEYGKLICYRNSAYGELFLFNNDRVNKDSYSVFLGDKEITVPKMLPHTQYRNIQMSKDQVILYLYQQSEDEFDTLTLEILDFITGKIQTIRIKLSELVMATSEDFSRNQFYFLGSTLYFSTQMEGTQYFASYDITTKTLNKVPLDGQYVNSVISSFNNIKVIWCDQVSLIIEEFDKDLKSTGSISAKFPEEIKFPVDFSVRRDIIQVYGNIIYGFIQRDTNYIYSFALNIDNGEWTDMYKISIKNIKYRGTDTKHVLKDGQQYYDLEEHIDNAKHFAR